MLSIKEFWSNLSRSTKIIYVVFSSTFLILLTLLVSYKFYFSKSQSGVVDLENWEKLQIANRPNPPFILSTKNERKFGISAKETFLLTTTQQVSEDDLKNKINTSAPVKIKKISDTQFEVSPVSKLNNDELIKFTVDDSGNKYNWTFQVTPKLKIVDSLPRDKAINVPANGGIEIAFNTDEYDEVAKTIEVNPKFNFRTEKHDQKLAIIPIDPLNYKSVYEIKVPSMNYSFSFQVADKDNNGRLSLNDNFQQVLPNEQLQSKVNFTIDRNSIIKTEVYKFNTSNDFINSRKIVDEFNSTWKTYYGEENKLDLSNTTKITEVGLPIQTQDQLNYLQLPFNLNEGFYFIQFVYANNEKAEHLWVQSTPVLGYVSVAKEQSMIWLNSINNEPVGESTVSVVGMSETYTTNNEGWTAFSTPDSLFGISKHYIQIKTQTGKELVLPIRQLEYQTKPNKQTQSDYWSYLYNERVLYKPTDTIYFWGVAKEKDSGNVPQTVDVKLGRYDNDDKLVKTVPTNSDGSFIGKIDLVDFNTGYYELKLYANGVEIESRSLSVEDFVKPEFKTEITTSKKAIYSNEKIAFNGKTGFFDGTPASNLPIKIYESYSSVTKNIEVNKNGEFDYEYQPKYDANSSYPRYESVVVSPQTATQGESEEFGTIMVYGSNLKIETKGSQDGSIASVKVNVSNIDLNRINNLGLDDPTSGPAKNQKIKIVTDKNWYEQKDAGTYYDFVEKVTQKKYDYVWHNEQVETRELTTDNNGVANYSLNLEKNKSFSVLISVTDGDGHVSTSRQYFYYSDGQMGDNSTKKAEVTIYNKEAVSVGEEVNAKITKNGEVYKDNDKNKFLFIIANRGRQEVYVQDTPEFNFAFKEIYKPNIFIGSIIFNGKYYEEVISNGEYDYYNQYTFSPAIVYYKKEDSKLKLTIQADKVKYAPGEKAKVSILATKNNNPVANANVNLVLVDEALAAMGKVNKPSTLDSLYKRVDSFVYYNYYTHQPIFPDGPMAERGGGGGDRNIFKDTAYFNQAITNNEGVAEFEINLPDNITNWLTYAEAITTEVDAGMSESSVITTKEFFVTSQFPKIVTKFDKPYLAINSFGIAINDKEKNVNGESVFTKDGSEISKNSFTISPYKENYVAFPKLANGNYEIAVRGKYNNYNDGVRLPLKVIDSRLEFKILEDLNSAKGKDYRKDKPVDLIISDEGRGKYYYDLKQYCGVTSNRVERILASLFAKQILLDKFDENDCINKDISLSEFQSSGGGLRQVKWGNSDLETTLWAVYIDQTKFNKEELIKYFESYINNGGGNGADGILANWGLSIVGKPQINNLKALSNKSTTFKEKILSALALNYVGENETAKEIYYDLLAYYAYVNKPYIRIQDESQDMNSYILNTSYMLLLSSKINSEYDKGMSLYLRDYRTEATGVILEVANISFINSELQKLPKTDTEAVVKSKYQNKTLDLTKGGSITIPLKSDELDGLTVVTTKGKTENLVSYFATPDQFNKLEGDKRLSLKKTVTKIKGDGSKIKLGDILQVTLSYDFATDAPNGCYELTDHIPSGLSYLDNPSNYGINTSNKGYLYDTGSNIAKGCSFNSFWWKNYTNNQSVYYVKVNSIGTYINEPSVMQSSLDPSIFQKTNETSITVEQ